VYGERERGREVHEEQRKIVRGIFTKRIVSKTLKHAEKLQND
jgi:hypothetical protein